MRYLPCLVLAALLGLPAAAQAEQCFAASKVYRIQALHGGRAAKEGWSVEANAFSQCVKRAEAADKALHARYPDGAYEFSLAATIGCHAPCN